MCTYRRSNNDPLEVGTDEQEDNLFLDMLFFLDIVKLDHEEIMPFWNASKKPELQ